MPPITARPVNHKQCKITRVLAIALILLTPTLSWSEPVKKPDTSKNISSLYYGHYKTISSRLFPSYKSALGKLTKPLFLSTDKITAKFYGPIKKEQYFFIENRESAAFVITWKALKIKKLALYHLDAHKAGHACCSYSSMETEHCTSLATLVAVFNMKKGLNTNYLKFYMRHSAVSFNRRRNISANMLIQAQTEDGKYYSYAFKLRQQVSYHFACWPRKRNLK